MQESWKRKEQRMKNPKINYEEYEMADGECVAMSTAPILMLSLRKKNKKAYETLSHIMVKGIDDKDVLGAYEFLYAAYINANQDEDTLSFEEFIENANPSYEENMKMVGEMISPSKKQDSEQPSKEQH